MVLIHISVFYVIFHITLQWKCKFSSQYSKSVLFTANLCHLVCAIHLFNRYILSSPSMAGSGLGTECGYTAKQEMVPATEELLKPRHRKEQFQCRFHCCHCHWSWVFFCHYLKLGIKFLIAQRTDLGGKLEISGRHADQTQQWAVDLSWRLRTRAFLQMKAGVST